VTDKQFDADEERFSKYRESHPSATHAQFNMERVAEKLKQGSKHHSLGQNLDSGDFWAAGAVKAAMYWRMGSISRRSKIIDYGCGSLRIGAHFIRDLDPGCFFALDVTDEFYEIGKQLVGEKLLQAKAPRFGVIGEEAVAGAAGFGADLVYSNAVCYQVYPDELQTYFGNLARLASKPGSQVIFNCMAAKEEVRYSHRSWARPLEVYKKGLNQLELVEIRPQRDTAKGEHVVTPMVLRFRRGGATMGDRMRGLKSALLSKLSRNRPAI
jgi:hypothetical protein